MKTPIVKRRFSLSCFRGGSLVLFALVFMQALVSCDDDKSYERKEFLIVSESVEKNPVKNVYCKVEGGRDTLYVFSNVEYKYLFETDDEEEEWVRIVSSDYLPEIEATRLIFEINPRGDDYLMRTGTLSVASQENYIGQFIPFNQGFNTRLSEDFSWLKYGTANPFDMDKDTPIKSWSDAQVKYGWQSTGDENKNAFCYGKNGYVRLGKEDMGADLISPYTNGIANDTILLLTFNAVSFVAETGEKDNNKLTVSILDGGVFASGKNTTNIELEYYDHTDPDLDVNMWNGTKHHIYIKNDESNPLTGNTRIRFITGTDVASGARNRLFIDNINLFIIDGKSHYLAEVDNLP